MTTTTITIIAGALALAAGRAHAQGDPATDAEIAGAIRAVRAGDVARARGWARETYARDAWRRATDAARAREIDRVARKLAAADAFSGVVMVARGDRVLYAGAFGQADRRRGIPMRLDTRFELASLAKTFVTVSIAKLVERGQLSWDDSLGKFFPDFPLAAAREKVRIRHLVTHSSGLQEFECEGRPCPASYRSMADHLRVAYVTAADSLRWEPGARSVYTNTNYILLGAIVEKASGRDLHDFVRSVVFQPAGMKDTRFHAPGPAPTGIARGYERRLNGGEIVATGGVSSPTRSSYGSPYAGAYGTARDVLRFAQALTSGRLLKPETVAVLFSHKPEAGNWGYGFDVLDADRGLVGHGGSWSGLSHTVDVFSQSGYATVILTNFTNGRSPLRETIWQLVP